MFVFVEKFVSQFYVIPYSMLPGNNVKVYNDVSTERCAELCIRETAIVCRSFDYVNRFTLIPLFDLTTAGSAEYKSFVFW